MWAMRKDATSKNTGFNPRQLVTMLLCMCLNWDCIMPNIELCTLSRLFSFATYYNYKKIANVSKSACCIPFSVYIDCFEIWTSCFPGTKMLMVPISHNSIFVLICGVVSGGKPQVGLGSGKFRKNQVGFVRF